MWAGAWLWELKVGETGFEPATARPPAECATRLRHSPWGFHFDGSAGLMPMGTSVRLHMIRFMRRCGRCKTEKPRGIRLAATRLGAAGQLLSAVPHRVQAGALCEQSAL